MHADGHVKIPPVIGRTLVQAVTARVHGRTLDRQLIDVGRELTRAGLVHGRSGNLSARDGARVRISVAGARLGRLRRDDLVWSSPCDAATVRRLPSSEVALHAAIYERRPDVGAIVHTHSPYATAWASVMTDGLELMLEEARYYGMGARVGVAPFAPAGGQRLAELAAMHLADGAAVLLERHGAVAVGADPQRALDVAESLEHQARVTWILASRPADGDAGLVAPETAIELRTPGSARRTPRSPTHR